MSKAFLATILLAVANAVTSPPEQLRQSIGTGLVGISAALSAGAATRKREKK